MRLGISYAFSKGAVLPLQNIEENDIRNVPGVYLRLLEKAMYAYERTNTICDGDRNMKSLYREPEWDALLDLLVIHGIVRKRTGLLAVG